MGWLWLVGSIKLYVSFAKEPYKKDDILQQRPIILSILLIVATPYPPKMHRIEQPRFLGTNSKWTRFSIWSCTARYWGSGFFDLLGFWGVYLWVETLINYLWVLMRILSGNSRVLMRILSGNCMRLLSGNCMRIWRTYENFEWKLYVNLSGNSMRIWSTHKNCEFSYGFHSQFSWVLMRFPLTILLNCGFHSQFSWVLWKLYERKVSYGVATISRLLRIIGLFCRLLSLL